MVLADDGESPHFAEDSSLLQWSNWLSLGDKHLNGWNLRDLVGILGLVVGSVHQRRQLKLGIGLSVGLWTLVHPVSQLRLNADLISTVDDVLLRRWDNDGSCSVLDKDLRLLL